MNRPKEEDYTRNEFEVSGKYVTDLEKYCTELEKALDKACEKLARSDACWDLSENGCDYECHKCWKKYLLREEE